MEGGHPSTNQTPQGSHAYGGGSPQWGRSRRQSPQGHLQLPTAALSSDAHPHGHSPVHSKRVVGTGGVFFGLTNWMQVNIQMTHRRQQSLEFRARSLINGSFHLKTSANPARSRDRGDAGTPRRSCACAGPNCQVSVSPGDTTAARRPVTTAVWS